MFSQVSDYYDAPELVFPIKHSESKMSIASLNTKCNQCGSTLTGLRGHVIERPTCIEVDYGGACMKCMEVVPVHIRWYGRYMMVNSSTKGWITLGSYTPWLFNLLLLIKKIFK